MRPGRTFPARVLAFCRCVVSEAAESLTAWPEHAEHGRWKRVKPCVYCACGARLYNGSLPEDIDGQRAMAAEVEAFFQRRQAKEEAESGN